MREVSRYICQTCGGEFPKWSGQCPSCNAWNSLVETVVSTTSTKKQAPRNKLAAKPLRLEEVKTDEKGRTKTGMGELDRVLGGGLVAGSVVLLAGEPGIGKSTLLTQLALKISDHRSQTSVLYVCGEESPEQVKLRVERVAGSRISNLGSDLLLLPETDVDQIRSQIADCRFQIGLVIVDSVQTLATQDLTGMAGSVGQIRESAFRLIEVAKRLGIPMVLVGHVTKEGTIAGPKVLEHMVDVVLELSGDKDHDFRILRTNKNRFGATDEVGVFTMGDSGMTEVVNPSDVFLEERQKHVAGSVVVATVTGLRPMLVEIQALVIPSQLAIPRRVSSGVDQRKLQILSAVLQKHCRLGLGGSDIFVNVVGGLTLTEPACDLGIALAIASGFTNKPVGTKTVVVGEVGLLGEIRKVGRLKQRLAEAKRLGYTEVVTPEKYRTLNEVVRKVLR